jgi:hypothetical protein
MGSNGREGALASMAAAESTESGAAAPSCEKENVGGCFTVDFSGGKAVSLQESFQQFRKERAKLYKLRTGGSRREKSKAEQDALREAFVERCHTYLGVVSVESRREHCRQPL